MATTDGGAGWLKRALKRAEEQASAEGRKLEEVAAERWGSLEKLKSMIAAAESKAKESGSSCEGNRAISSVSIRYSASDSRLVEKWKGSSASDTKFSLPGRDSGTTQKTLPTMTEIENQRRKRVFKRLEDTGGESSYSRDRSVTIRAPRLPRVASMPGWKSKSFVTESEQEQITSKDQQYGLRKRYPDEEGETSKPRSIEQSVVEQEIPSSVEVEVAHETAVEELVPHSEVDLNKLHAKILKAEMIGNTALVEKLKAKLYSAQSQPSTSQTRAESKKKAVSSAVASEECLAWKTDQKTGLSLPLTAKRAPVIPSAHDTAPESSLNADLREALSEERRITGEDVELSFAALAGKSAGVRLDDDFTIDDAMLNKKRKVVQKHTAREDQEHKRRIIHAQRQADTAVDSCIFCLESQKMQKHLVIAVGLKTYLRLPDTVSLTEGHCLIVPISHVLCSTALDEDVYEEMKLWRKGLTAMFRSRDEDCVFIETAMRFQHHNHMFIECIPVPEEMGDTAPVYFKKAFMECDVEWAQNKRLVDLSKKDIRKSVPKGFPYVSVDFGLQGGFAHVIEDEALFPLYFCKEIVGGMLDVDHHLWRKPPKEKFEDQLKKVDKFNSQWRPFDWTERAKKAIEQSADDGTD